MMHHFQIIPYQVCLIFLSNYILQLINRQISCLSLSCLTPQFVENGHNTIPYLILIFLYFYYKYALLWSLAHIYSRLLFFSLTRLRFFLVLSHFVCESLNKCCKIQQFLINSELCRICCSPVFLFSILKSCGFMYLGYPMYMYSTVTVFCGSCEIVPYSQDLNNKVT